MQYYKRLALAIWSAPYGLIGYLLGFIALIDRRNYIVYESPVPTIVINGPVADWFQARGWKAFTLGWAVYVWGDANCTDEVLKHEAMHVRQAMRWGIMFPVIYLALLIVYGYTDHPMERE